MLVHVHKEIWTHAQIYLGVDTWRIRTGRMILASPFLFPFLCCYMDYFYLEEIIWLSPQVYLALLSSEFP